MASSLTRRLRTIGRFWWGDGDLTLEEQGAFSIAHLHPETAKLEKGCCRAGTKANRAAAGRGVDVYVPECGHDRAVGHSVTTESGEQSCGLGCALEESGPVPNGLLLPVANEEGWVEVLEGIEQKGRTAVRKQGRGRGEAHGTLLNSRRA